MAKRMRVEAYIGKVYSKTEKKYEEICRNAVELGARCGGKVCDTPKSKTIHCHAVSEDERKELFDVFWKQIDWDQRRIYVCSMINVVEKKQGKGDASRLLAVFNIISRFNKLVFVLAQ